MTRHIKSRDSGFSRKYVMYKANYAQFSFRVRICDPRIAICGSNVFLRITLSSFCEICESKSSVGIFVFRETKFLFTLQARQIAYILLQKVLNCTLFSCIWIAFWPKTTNGRLTALAHTL